MKHKGAKIFHTKLSKKNVLGIQNVTFRLFFNNKHLRFCCQIITYGHHLSKKIITFLWNVQMFKYSRGTFSMISTHKKFFLVFEIFHTKLSEKNVLGIRNVTFRLFFINKHLCFCCQIITYGHHLSKKIITSQFSQFSFLASIWHFGPYFSYMT